MLTLLSFFLGVLPSFSVCWLEDEDEEELVLALESSSDIANPPPHPANGPSLCVWLLRAAAAAAAAAAAGPGHSCLALAGREAEVQQQQLLTTRQWLPRPHTLRATPPLRPAPRPSPAAPGGRGPGAPSDPAWPEYPAPGGAEAAGRDWGPLGRVEPGVTRGSSSQEGFGKGLGGEVAGVGGKDGTLLARTLTPPQK